MRRPGGRAPLDRSTSVARYRFDTATAICICCPYCPRGGPDLSGPLFFPPALTVPAASSMEAAGHAVAEAAAYAVAEASDMGDTHAVGETATPKMGDIYAAVGETVGET